MPLDRWTRLHAQTLADVWNRWRRRPEAGTDPLIEDDRWNGNVWLVRSELELVRLVGGLHWLNPKLMLWFRGEHGYYERALPSRLRGRKDPALTVRGMRWLNEQAARDRALRDRSQLARAALLQHYGCPTSFLDVTSSLETACAFAFPSSDNDLRHTGHVRVYALPRHTSAVTTFDETDVVLVDLRAEMPSYCLRPHVQQGGFMARTEAAFTDISEKDPTRIDDGSLDELCIGHIRLAFDGYERFFLPRLLASSLYPPASDRCNVCPDEPDLSKDYVLHLLRCLAGKQITEAPPADFPDTYSEEAEQQRATHHTTIVAAIRAGIFGLARRLGL